MSLHCLPVRSTNQYRDQYSFRSAPYSSAATHPGLETNKYKQTETAFAARAGEHGADFYNHRANEVGYVTGPYAGHDARHAGFNPEPHHFNAGYNQVAEPNVELRRPFCGMTSSRTQKCSPLQESMRLMHQMRRCALPVPGWSGGGSNKHEFTPSLKEEQELGVYPTGMYFSHAQTRVVGDQLRVTSGDKYNSHESKHVTGYVGGMPANPTWSSPRLALEAKAFRDETRGGQWDAPRHSDFRAGRLERPGWTGVSDPKAGLVRGEVVPRADAHH